MFKERKRLFAEFNLVKEAYTKVLQLSIQKVNQSNR